MEFMSPKDQPATVARDPSREGKLILIPTWKLRMVCFPVYRGDWKSFVKNYLAEVHVSGVNEAIMVAAKAHSKKWEWPFSPDPRQETLLPSNDVR